MKYDQKLAEMIDHTMLKPETSEADIRRLCSEAKTYRFATVCVNPYWVSLASELLLDSGVGVCAVIGFPLGATTMASKRLEAEEAIQSGAAEIDMVLNIGALKSRLYKEVKQDIQGVVNVCSGRGEGRGGGRGKGGIGQIGADGEDVKVKVILETGLLTDDEKRIACRLAVEAGAAFVKTSTGFGQGGATEADICLMREAVGANIGVKASGGIRDRETAMRMIEAGASRIGASASLAIVT